MARFPHIQLVTEKGGVELCYVGVSVASTCLKFHDVHRTGAAELRNAAHCSCAELLRSCNGAPYPERCACSAPAPKHWYASELQA